MIFLGTGASEAIPNPFCDCEVGRKALISNDPREKRGRSAFSIDDRNLIDYGPDVISAAGRFGVSLARLRNIFFTHFHSDHCDFVNWENPRMSVTPPPAVNIYLSEPALEGLRQYRDLILSMGSKDYERDIRFYERQLSFVTLRPYETIAVDDMQVSALRGIHSGRFTDEIVLNYLFKRNGKRFLYAADTGPYCDENFEFLKGHMLDILVTECSFGISAPEKKHMTCESVKQMVDRFRTDGVVNDRTEIWLTHIGHKGGLNHMELQRKMKDLVGPQIDVAYDGLRIVDF